MEDRRMIPIHSAVNRPNLFMGGDRDWSCSRRSWPWR